jgi:hypothetical protein
MSHNRAEVLLRPRSTSLKQIRDCEASVSLLVNPELRVALPVPGQQRRDDGDLVLGDLREQRLQARPDDQRS